MWKAYAVQSRPELISGSCIRFVLSARSTLYALTNSELVHCRVNTISNRVTVLSEGQPAVEMTLPAHGNHPNDGLSM